ncbi:MAG: hypothetical protein B7Z73_16730, partial [Planctomycetia bacterium 21-64-5]
MEAAHGGRRISSTEYRKTEHETHEVMRSDEYEKRVVESETRETSVSRSETVEIRRGGRVGSAHEQPTTPPADWFANLPDLVRLSLSGVERAICPDAELFDGDYLLNLLDRHDDACRWEVRFSPHCRLYRATLTAHCGVGVPPAPSVGSGGTAAAAVQIVLSAALEGGVPGPCWTGTASAAFEQTVTLRLDPSIAHREAAGCRWPPTVTLMPIRPAVGQAFQPDISAASPAAPAPRHDIPSAPTAAERAAMALMVGSSSSSSSSGGRRKRDRTCDCHCVCPCPCTSNGTRPGTPAPNTSLPSSPMEIPKDSEAPVQYGNGEITLAVTDLSAGGFGQEFTHTRIFSNRLGGDEDFGNGYNWLIRDLPLL